ncbi:hypothetical protein SAMD00019534_010170, partial [Acytostelium subglobosum LB1]|uniref:hypothetical protein n=1 Tax=Acytostelium subglobosum LB1 TaxID=1410327 RepID=UPI0006451F3D
MIKIIGTLLFIFATIALAQSNTLMVNFQPRAEQACTGDVSGVGYAASLNDCIDLDTVSYEFIVTALRAGWKIFDDGTCAGNFTDDSYKNGTCVTDLQFTEYIAPTPFATMYISQEPIVDVGSGNIIGAIYTHETCGLGSLVAYAYATNGTTLTTDDGTVLTLTCDGEQPKGQQCLSGSCKSYNFDTNCEQSFSNYYLKITCSSL